MPVTSATATVWHLCAERLLYGELDEVKFRQWLIACPGHVMPERDYPGAPMTLVAEMYRPRYARYMLTRLLMKDMRCVWSYADSLATTILAEVAHD